MRALALWMGMALWLTATCGSGAAGSDPRAGTGSGDDAAVPGASCESLACTGQVDDLLMGCMASGACTKQTTSTGEVRCYDNGVKWSRSGQTSSGTTGLSSSIVVSAKKGGTLCYTKTFASFIPSSGGAAAASSTLAITDGTGTTVATANGDASGAVTVTCPVGVATKVDDACYIDLTAYIYYSGTPADCTEGSCTLP